MDGQQARSPLAWPHGFDYAIRTRLGHLHTGLESKRSALLWDGRWKEVRWRLLRCGAAKGLTKASKPIHEPAVA